MNVPESLFINCTWRVRELRRTIGAIIDHPRPPSRIAEIFRTAGIDVDIQIFGTRFVLAFGVKPATSST
jgi:hypothetical protein